VDPVVEVACRPFGVEMFLVLILPGAASSMLAAFWAPPRGGLYLAKVGLA
jgi:hypothetical protein